MVTAVVCHECPENGKGFIVEDARDGFYRNFRTETKLSLLGQASEQEAQIDKVSGTEKVKLAITASPGGVPRSIASTEPGPKGLYA